MTPGSGLRSPLRILADGAGKSLTGIPFDAARIIFAHTGAETVPPKTWLMQPYSPKHLPFSEFSLPFLLAGFRLPIHTALASCLV